MQRYKCRDCAFTFSEADRSWDSAIDSGRCPKCSQPLYDFPIPVRGHKVESAVPLPPPSTHRPTPSVESSPSVSAARFCSNCGAPVALGNNFCAQCEATLPTSRSAEPVSSKVADNSQNSNIVSPSVETKPSWLMLPLDTANIPWKAAGKVTVIRCPVSKNKEKYEGDWSYEYGLMSRRIFFKKEVVDLRQKLVKVELAPEFITVLAGYKKASEVTPASLMLGLSMPVLVESYQERKRSSLSQMVLAVIYLNDSWFYSYMNAEIYVELMMHGDQPGAKKRGQVL